MKPTPRGLIPPGYRLCPCDEGCGEWSKSLTGRGHARGCTCRSCLGARNRRKGQAAQRGAHQKLGGKGWVPTNEEWGRPYDLRVQLEVKAGAQCPASFLRFTQLDWTRRALSQAERTIPVGESAFPAVWMQLPGRGGRWMVVRIP